MMIIITVTVACQAEWRLSFNALFIQQRTAEKCSFFFVFIPLLSSFKRSACSQNPQRASCGLHWHRRMPLYGGYPICHATLFFLKGASFCREENAILKNMSEEYNIIFCQRQATGKLLSKWLKQRLAVFRLHYSLLCTLKAKERGDMYFSFNINLHFEHILAHESFSQTG